MWDNAWSGRDRRDGPCTGALVSYRQIDPVNAPPNVNRLDKRTKIDGTWGPNPQLFGLMLRFGAVIRGVKLMTVLKRLH